MRIVHFSDAHGRVFALPWAHLYIASGDMLPNFRKYTIKKPDGSVAVWKQNNDLLTHRPNPRPEGEVLEKRPVAEREIAMQTRYLAAKGCGYVRRHFGNPKAPVVCVRGNHDYVDLLPMFGDKDGEVFEISDDPTRTYRVTVDGRLFVVGGVRGISRHRGEWMDELTEEEFEDRVRRLPTDLDILVTHAPPFGILDAMPVEGNVGTRPLRQYVSRHNPVCRPLALHCFGHIHESRAVCLRGSTLFSNASCGYNVIDV